MENRIWLKNGSECEVLDKTASGMLVVQKILYGYYDGENTEIGGEILLISNKEAYKQPTEKISQEILDLQQTRDALQKEITRLRSERQSMQFEFEKTIKFYTEQDHCLEKLDRYLRGEITHFFVVEYGCPKIYTLEEVVESDKDQWGYNGQALLVLHITKKGKKELQWSLSPVNLHECTPCVSFSDAQELFIKHITEEISKGYYDESRVKLANKYDITLPDNYIESVIKKVKTQHENDMQSKQKAMLEAQTKFSSLIAKLQGETNESD